MRKLIAMICLGFLSGVFALSAQDAPKPPSGVGGPSVGRGMNPEMGTQMGSEYLRQNDPKKFEEMQKLRQENPEEFKKQMAELSEKMKEKNQKEREEFKALADKYRETKSDVDKAAVRAKLEEYMKKRVEMQKRRVDEMEKNLAQAKANLADEEKSIQSKIDERLNQILSNKDGQKGESSK
jgi:ATP-dependent Clp protease ATP-binding subunit ClpA